MNDEEEPRHLPEEPSGQPALPPPPERDPFWGYSDLLMFAGLAVPCMLLGFGLVKGIMALFRVHTPLRAAELLAAEFTGYALLFLVLRIMLQMQYGRPFWQSLGWKPAKLSIPILVLFGVGTSFLIAALGTLIRTPQTDNLMMELLKDRRSMILLAVFGVTAGPVAEELIFRGFLQPLLVRSLGVSLGILTSALPFGLLHYQEYGNSWRHVLLISLAGAMFGVVRQTTGSTKASAIMHSAYNSVIFAAVLAQRGLPQ
jgi:hypothetical protein